MANNSSYINQPSTHKEERRTLAQLHDHHSELYPDREAFVIYDDEGRRYSYTFQEVKEQSLKTAAILLKVGIDKGQRVALFAMDCIEYVWCFLALNRIGANAILIPVNWATGKEAIALVERFKCQALLLYPSGEKSFDQCFMEEARKSLGEGKVVLLGNEDAPCDWLKYHLNDLLNTTQDFNMEEVYKRQDAVLPDDPVVCTFTSGSTGEPKGAQYSNLAIVNSAFIFANHWLGTSSSLDPVNTGCRFFNDRPFHWIGCVMIGFNSVFSLGFTLVTSPASRSVLKNNHNLFLRVLQDEKCFVAHFLPSVIHDLITYPCVETFDLSNLKRIITGGQVVSPSHLIKLGTILPDSLVVNVYGMTELFPISTKITNPCPVNSDALLPSGMQVCSQTEVKIVNDDREIVPISAKGEIWIRSPYSFIEYLEDPKAAMRDIDSTGWIHTDDAGFIDQHGMLHICGRLSDAICRATDTLYPSEIEKVLSNYPDVTAVAVIGVPDERLGEEICACVIPKAGSPLESDVNSFEEWASKQWEIEDEIGLTPRPKYTLVMKAFPHTKTGKTHRRALKELAVQLLNQKFN